MWLLQKCQTYERKVNQWVSSWMWNGMKKKRVLFMIRNQSFQNVQTNKPSAVVVLLTFCTNKTRWHWNNNPQVTLCFISYQQLLSRPVSRLSLLYLIWTQRPRTALVTCVWTIISWNQEQRPITSESKVCCFYLLIFIFKRRDVSKPLLSPVAATSK